MDNELPFLGNEFLTWLWFKMETESNNCFPGNKISLSKGNESITIKGEDSDLIVGKVALSDGLVVNEINITYLGSTFTLKGSDMSFNVLKTPKVEGDGSEDESEGIVLENIYLIKEVSEKVDELFQEFIDIRMNNWNNKVEKIKKWINEG